MHKSLFHHAGIQRRFVDTDVGQIHVRCSRATPEAEHPPLVLLHASPASSITLVPLVEGLGQSRYCYAPDTLGFGDSGPPPVSKPEAEDYADWVLLAIDALGLDKFHLYGSHTGAHIAVELAINHPDRVKKLILDGIALFEQKEKETVLDHYAPEVSPDMIGSQLNWAWHFIRDQTIFFPYFQREAAKLRNMDMANAETLHTITVDVLKALGTYHLGYRAAFRHKDRERLPLITQETLVTADLSDPLNIGAELGASLVPNSMLWLSPGYQEPGALETKIQGLDEFLRDGRIKL